MGRFAQALRFAAGEGAHNYWVWVVRTFAFWTQVANEPVGAQQR